MTMNQAEIDAFLQEVHLARVATTRPDGRPHVAPVWYLWEDNHLYIETARHAVKARNLRANPHIAVTVDITTGGMRYKYVILEGPATLIEDDAGRIRQIAARIYSRYVGVEGLQTPAVQEMLHGDIVIIQLRPARFITADELSPSNLGPL